LRKEFNHLELLKWKTIMNHGKAHEIQDWLQKHPKEGEGVRDNLGTVMGHATCQHY
jgi:hypothetical protein